MGAVLILSLLYQTVHTVLWARACQHCDALNQDCLKLLKLWKQHSLEVSESAAFSFNSKGDGFGSLLMQDWSRKRSSNIEFNWLHILTQVDHDDFNSTRVHCTLPWGCWHVCRNFSTHTYINVDLKIVPMTCYLIL